MNGETWTYTYDLGGNILSKSKYAYTRGSLGTALSTVAYGYTDSSWADLLTSYKGKTITYDAIGNPLDDGTWEYTWEKGRQLASMEGASSGWDFTYDANGQRLTKTNGTLTYHYIYNDMQLMYMKVTQNTSTVCEMYFQYGQLGLMAIQYISSSLTDTYYVVTNAQGDVVALVDGNGTVVVNYTYDAWGKLQAMTGSKASTVGKYNPIRYRGYVYDTETQLYYLNTRYYNPDMGRFINADSYASTGDELLGSNMFAYCGNNPVNLMDPTGEIAIATLIFIGSAIFGLVTTGYTAYVEYNAGYSMGEIIVDSVMAGTSAFLFVYSLGMTAYDCYLHYCYLNGLTPVTEIGGSASISDQLQTCAITANNSIDGKGAVAGTKKHAEFKLLVDSLGIKNLRTEVSFLNGDEVKYGTKGSVRFDVILMSNDRVIEAWDFKTGSATLSGERINQMIKAVGYPIPIYEIR